MVRCDDCIYFAEGGNCTVLKLGGINPAGPSCQLFDNKNGIVRCDVCGNWMTQKSIIAFINEDQTHIICPNCAQKSNTCELCKERIHCEFETSPSGTPKVVQQRSLNGFVSQSKNPARIDETCKKGCVCWDKEENYCLRENGTCKNYTLFL